MAGVAGGGAGKPGERTGEPGDEVMTCPIGDGMAIGWARVACGSAAESNEKSPACCCGDIGTDGGTLALGGNAAASRCCADGEADGGFLPDRCTPQKP